MARTLRSDKLLFWPTLLLVCVSLVMVYSASLGEAVERDLPPYYFLVRQLVWAVLGFCALALLMRFDYHELRRPTVVGTLLVVTFVALVAVFFFPPRNETHRWMTFGPISIQPSEMAKLAVIIFAASLLERRMHRIGEPVYALMPVAGVTMLFVLLIVRQPDFGTSAVLVLAVTSMLFVAGLSYRYLLGSALVLIPAAMALIVTSEYRMRRVRNYLDPWADQFDGGYQAVQSFIAVGSGGVLGKGLMQSVQKLFYIPEAHNDFIFAIIGEELGLLGTTMILACFVLIVWRGIRASVLAPDRFGALLAVGVTMLIGIQALVNLSVVTGLLPTKGIPLPFVSAGGSSLFVSLAAMGILLNISQHASPSAAAASGTT